MAATTKECSLPTFPTIHQCPSIGREKHTVVADMDGTLLRGRSSIPYFALVAFEVGGILRLLFLLLASPLAGLLYYCVSESAGIRVLVFATFEGMRVSDIELLHVRFSRNSTQLTSTPRRGESSLPAGNAAF